MGDVAEQKVEGRGSILRPLKIPVSATGVERMNAATALGMSLVSREHQLTGDHSGQKATIPASNSLDFLVFLDDQNQKGV